jgi:hypothetical protein
MVRVRGVCVDGAHLVRHSNAPFDVWLDQNDSFIRGIDYWSADETAVVREYRAEEVTIIDGIAIAGLMSMIDQARNHSTLIRLEDAWFDRPIEARVFEPSFRKHTRDYLASL